MQRQLPREDYTVGWVCALPLERAAAQAMLDERHTYAARETSDNDDNVYCLGSVAGHNVVIVCLPAGCIGNNPAATVATQLRASFKGIRFGLMLGIGGGVPSSKSDMRLGDVVVSQPQGTLSGVVQYDFGKRLLGKLERIGSLNTPPQILLSAVSDIQANDMVGQSTLSDHLSILERYPNFQRLKAGPDVLFKAGYNHEHGDTCDQCSVEGQQPRSERRSGAEVTVHYGTIASGNQVMKDAAERDRISAELGGVLCFEMEAAGLMNSFPCLVIRGIADYADSHKNHKWQRYAAGTAAAYAKELLSAIPPPKVMNTRRVDDVMRSGDKRCLPSSPPDQTPNKRTKTWIPSSPHDNSAMQRTVPVYSLEPSRTPLNNEQKKILLESLRFEQIDARQMTIKQAHAKTCKWLLKCEKYLNWLDKAKLDEHNGFLWIKGKAGTGKSTLMKYALINARKTRKDHIVLSFFFNARGDNIEKSTLGTYRSLLLQLLERLPALQGVFDSLSLSTSNFTADHQWNIETLKTLLEQAIQSLGSSSVLCFIDALDECDQEEIREMVRFFEQIGELAVSAGICFQICFSSRHYPHITIRKGLELVLEGEEGHKQDITNYIESELMIGKSKIAQRMKIELQEKASGIFMWVVLVVGILNTESDRGQVHTLQQKLREIPRDLHQLFHDILTRGTHNKEGLVLCIQWVLFAKQPLSPNQLYHAILSGVNLEAATYWDPEEITQVVVKRFILDSSKGLAEITVSKEPRVQFIHESVRDFLLNENGLGKIWPEYEDNFRGQSHNRLKQCCLDYIRIDMVTPLKIPDHLPKSSSKPAAILLKSATQAFPFLEYAVHNVLYHADTAVGAGMSQADFFVSFPLTRWVKLDNMFEKHEVRRHTKGVSLLYLLAEFNAANLIRMHPSIKSCLDLEKERYGCAFFAASAMGNQEVMQACVESLEIHHSRAEYGEADIREERVGASLGRDFKYSKKAGKGGLLLHAVEIGNAAVIAYLLGLGDLNIEFKDSQGRTALYIAAEKGARTIARMLVETGADVEAQGGYYGNALQAASAGGYKEIATLLLQSGADVNSQGGHYCNALCAASAKGHKEIAALLVEKGADIGVQGQSSDYSNALYAASIRGHKEIVALLLDKGANVNARGGFFGNALQAASANGYKEIAALLVENGANINAQGGAYSNALYAASFFGYKETAVLLVENGANVNARGGFFGNALQAASANGYKEIAALLVERGAGPDTGGGLYSNALHKAIAKGHEAIATMLRKNGA